MTLSRLFVFLSVVLTVTFGLHYYLWARLVRDPSLAQPWGTLATLAIVVLGAMMPLGMVLSRVAPRSIATPVMWVVYSWMGLAFFLLVLLAPADLGSSMYSWLQSGAIDPARRQLLARTVGAFAGFGAVGLASTALWSAVRPAAVKRVSIQLEKFPASMNGFKLVQLTDIHVGPTIGKAFIDDLVARTNALRPDLVAITGDLVDGSVKELAPLLDGLRELRATHGVYFVTGNHEYYSGVDAWIAHLSGMGIRVLRNDRVSIGDAHGSGGFDLAGVDDYHAHQFGNGHGMSFPRITSGRDTSRALVLLAHQPKAIEHAEPHGVDLQLSGHTHGGQMYPFNHLVKLQQPYVAGLDQHGRAKVYVSRGTGYWGPPMRLAAPSEITEITLSRG